MQRTTEVNENANIFCVYNLPNNSQIESTLTQIIKEKTGYNLEQLPKVQLQPDKIYCDAAFRIENPEKFLEVSQKLRYFTFEGKPCRGLPYSSHILCFNETDVQEKSLSVTNIPKSTQSQDLEKFFEPYGEIISCEVFINKDYSSTGKGLVYFKDSASTARALSDTKNRSEITGFKFPVKNKDSLIQKFSSIFVKNMPDEWQQPELQKAFEVFGPISAILTMKQQSGIYVFITYECKDSADQNQGQMNAAKAVQEMHNKEINGKILQVKPMFKKSEREKQINETKINKKGCTLYVKNFLAETTEEDLMNLFQPYGEIQSVKYFGEKDNRSPFALVSFKTPGAAQKAKNSIFHINNRPLYINNYEPKEKSSIQRKDKDEHDWQRYELIIKKSGNLICGQMQELPQQLQQNGKQRNSEPVRSSKADIQINSHINLVNQNNHSQGSNQSVGQASSLINAPQNGHLQNKVIFEQSVSPPLALEFYNQTHRIYGAVVYHNPTYKTMVGHCIFQFVVQLAGHQLANKITDLLLDLPIEQIQSYLTNFDLFNQRVTNAYTFLQQFNQIPTLVQKAGSEPQDYM